MLGREVRWALASRRHRAGRAHARHVMNTVTPIATTISSGNDALLWVGHDDRGIELEVIAALRSRDGHREEEDPH